MISLPGMKKHNMHMAAKYILLTLKVLLFSANKQLSWKKNSQKAQKWVSFSILTCSIGQFTQLLKFLFAFGIKME